MSAWSIIQFDKLHAGFDFDAEHYHPERLLAWKKLSKSATKRVSDFAHEIEDLCDPNPVKPSFDLTAALGQFLEFKGTSAATSTKKLAIPGDVIVSRLRSYLHEVCVIPARSPDFSPQLSTEFIVLRSTSRFSAVWLASFILSKPVQGILRCSQTGSNHPRFSAETLLSIPIPPPVEKIIVKLNELTEDAVLAFEKASYSYPEAEVELLDRIGWEALCKQPAELFYTRNIDEVFKTERADAEFFQPRFTRLRSQLKKRGAQMIGDVCTKISRGVQPELFPDGEVVVVDSKSVRPVGVDSASAERTSRAFHDQPQNAKGRVRYGDVLLNSTGRGTLGRATCYTLKEPGLCDNHVAILRPDTKVCHPLYLSLFLNSSAGFAQSEQFETGSSGQIEIYPDHIAQFLIFLPKQSNGKIDMAWQERLAAKVEAAATAKAIARAKLAEAIAFVEAAVK